jgi:hypothetical protein
MEKLAAGFEKTESGLRTNSFKEEKETGSWKTVPYTMKDR